MRYSPSVKNSVRQFRRKGWSLNQIKAETRTPITTIRTWISDIVLSKEQQDILEKRIQTALQGGRARVQTLWKEERLQKEKILLQKGKASIANLTRREFFIAGIALYWAEGFKNLHERRLGFCNSDPEMILFC
ncbi:MAG: hypothetical protein A3F31_05215 [Candidatus Levybacteria bacterium RIFCSPHIGHO2_12_FULL_38_12]|nr:MAG: hypothetical protein A2770_03535 [Candidatus Levybacteria bacterium RIFCSPHIGHO2_01_FULL_38_12]OGH22171.1 MAG: hypothetical protein A3F31_05215 [Candidatus Levybacteria bacterium RIFCSPHIGHO2_12_FULL_38_12]OGH34510.1 MAG: hypothetical protein A3A47_00985 [Candidatus Levybacteria bacterium RIFCSPLOWO2_01_FULL_37_20]OGH44758.1 MAG: hypothetical protein A3J14_00345 [Candidatus Levybacteria bacterium RIFCSPLOWO2_02_FULL_37_18]